MNAEYLPPELDPNLATSSERSSDPITELARAQADYDAMLDWWERRHPVKGPKSRWNASNRWPQVQMRLAAAKRAVKRTATPRQE
ncbi:hypothetical protein [Microbacterium sp. YY-01]|uniref:hypothetical protein n=1 Tax=Microbacterium sp. YY-01 TaxID=3421634 RepID=UPI003D168268